MSLTPAWAPNLHPLVVHLPIALLAAAAAVDLASLFLRARPGVRHTATWLYIGGAATAVVAYFTGDSAAKAMALPADVALLVDAHADWAFRTTWLFAFFASARLAISYILSPTLPVLVGTFLLALLGIGTLVETVAHGSQLVFQHGVGVQAVARDSSDQSGSRGPRGDDGGCRRTRGARRAGDASLAARGSSVVQLLGHGDEANALDLAFRAGLAKPQFLVGGHTITGGIDGHPRKVGIVGASLGHRPAEQFCPDAVVLVSLVDEEQRHVVVLTYLDHAHGRVTGHGDEHQVIGLRALHDRGRLDESSELVDPELGIFGPDELVERREDERGHARHVIWLHDPVANGV